MCRPFVLRSTFAKAMADNSEETERRELFVPCEYNPGPTARKCCLSCAHSPTIKGSSYVPPHYIKMRISIIAS